MELGNDHQFKKRQVDNMCLLMEIESLCVKYLVKNQVLT
jgi:hypothetical protein